VELHYRTKVATLIAAVIVQQALSRLPKRAPRPELARLITHHYFQVSPRTLERWPISWLTLNNRAHGDVAEAFAIAQQKLDEATPIRGGQSDTRGRNKA